MADDPADWSRPRVAAGVLFFDEDGRVLLVKPTYKEGWDIPGGYVNIGETPRQAAVREVKEELGLDIELGEPLVIDWAPHPDEGDKILFVFDGGTLAASTAVSPADTTEIERVEFVDAFDLDRRLIARLSRRVGRAIAARASMTTRYLEPGLPS
ncbi:MAG: NUDIX domain-containing protein [Sporichthyaceae bacterium]